MNRTKWLQETRRMRLEDAYFSPCLCLYLLLFSNDMNASDLASSIDLTLLKPDLSHRDIEDIIEDSLKYPFASLCVPPFYVPFASEKLKGKRRICTVIGFPLGYQTKAVKLHEAGGAVKSGADELDVVINISAFKSGQYGLARNEIEDIVNANKGIIIKAIIETSYLTDEEKIKACEIAIEAGANFVKTSTGFGPRGATIEDVKLLVKTASGRIKVKASGGIKDLNTTLKMIEAGASRIGTSSGIKIMEEFLINGKRQNQ